MKTTPSTIRFTRAARLGRLGFAACWVCASLFIGSIQHSSASAPDTRPAPHPALPTPARPISETMAGFGWG